MNMRRKPGASTNRKKGVYGGEMLDNEHFHNPTRKPYMPPIIIQLELEDVGGSKVSHVIEGSSGLMAES